MGKQRAYNKEYKVQAAKPAHEIGLTKSAIIIVFFVEKCYNEINTLMRWRNRNGRIIQKIMDYAD